MPGTTPVYGFPYPEPTDLVADYPALGQQLAEDIEAVLPTIGGLAPATPTSIANSGGTATLSGNTVTFTGVSSVSMNGCFTGTYNNYCVVISDLISSGGVECFVRLRASGSDNSTTNYALTRVVTDSAVSADRSVSANAWKPTGTDTACSTGLTLTVTNPQTATETSILTAAAQGGTGASNYFVTGGGNFRATTQFDGFTFYPASGTMTGTVSVYGYKK